MFKILISFICILLCINNNIFAKQTEDNPNIWTPTSPYNNPVYFEPDNWYNSEFGYSTVVFSGYDQNKNYLVVVDVFDHDVKSLLDKKLRQQFYPHWKDRSIPFLEYRCIKPKTAVKKNDYLAPNTIKNKTTNQYAWLLKVVGELDINCDCTKWNFYNIGNDSENNTDKPINSCYGFSSYTWSDFDMLSQLIFSNE
jgi:hypothetical protein